VLKDVLDDVPGAKIALSIASESLKSTLVSSFTCAWSRLIDYAQAKWENDSATKELGERLQRILDHVPRFCIIDEMGDLHISKGCKDAFVVFTKCVSHRRSSH
jgi:hypothetical protein